MLPFSCTRSLQEAIHTLRDSLRRLSIDSILLGLSGGADSVLTFHLLRLAGEGIPGFRLGTAHVNFNLRGEESLRDERFVRSLLLTFPSVGTTPIEQHFTSFDTHNYCTLNSLSIEMGARRLRHEWFDSLIARHGFQRLATGHNADDNQETLLLNLMRGSGTRGLRGMLPDNGRIIRPLLQIPRAHILNLLAEIKYPDFILREFPQGYITDSSNLTSDYRRNFLRHEVLPLLRSRWEGTDSALQTSLRLLGEENKIIEQAVSNTLRGHEEFLPWEIVASFPSPLTLIARWIDLHHGNLRIADEILTHMPPLGEQCATPGRRWSLGESASSAAASASIVTTPIGLRLEPALLPGDINARRSTTDDDCAGHYSITCHQLDADLYRQIRRAGKDELWLAADPKEFYWRTPLPADRMRLFGRGSKLVSDILLEAKIPQNARAAIRMLVSRADGEIIWIPGIRRSGTHLIPEPDRQPTIPVWHLSPR